MSPGKPILQEMGKGSFRDKKKRGRRRKGEVIKINGWTTEFSYQGNGRVSGLGQSDGKTPGVGARTRWLAGREVGELRLSPGQKVATTCAKSGRIGAPKNEKIPEYWG